MKQYDIWLAELPDSGESSSVMKGVRPVLIVSNDKANEHSPVITAVPLTSRMKKYQPTHVLLRLAELAKVSTALCEQILTLDKSKLIRQLGSVSDNRDIAALKRAIRVQLNIFSEENEEKYVR